MNAQPAALNQGLARLALFVLLLANTVAQLAGGAMMLTEPSKLAGETFGVSITGEAASLVAVLGGATLGYALVSGTAAVAVLERRASASVLVFLLSAMLVAVGAVMLGQGLRIGVLDLAKGMVFLAVGLAYHRRTSGG
jgi:hypothetical protein